jgi:hypothetical protein
MDEVDGMAGEGSQELFWGHWEMTAAQMAVAK